MVRLALRYKYAILAGIAAASLYTWYYVSDYAAINAEVFHRAELTLEEVVAQEVQSSNPNELLPDLVPLPARDLQIAHNEHGQTLLRFSTTYFNQGRGTLELRADPATAGIREDIERDVLQRIYTVDGSYRDKVVGNFLWHQEHLHYHYEDFVVYDLTSEDDPDHPELTGVLQKSTFCLRDVSRVLADIAGAKEAATYDICGKELQGVSVGWGDTYYHDYPDQALDITALESGTYRLTFVANPERRLDELAYANNTSYTIFRYDRAAETIEVIEEYPANLPEVEHVHLEDPFGM